MMEQEEIAPPMPLRNSDKADLLAQIRPDKVVEVIRKKLLGEEEINGVWVKQPHLQDRALTEKGAADIANLMLSVSNQSTSISRLKDHEIRERTLSIVKTAQLMCNRNWKEYGIKGTDQLHFVHEIIMSNTFITLKQPEGEGIRKMIIGVLSEHKVTSESSEKSGFSLFRRKKE